MSTESEQRAEGQKPESAGTVGEGASSPAAAAVELPFEAEVQRVLRLVIDSLYTHREVFLRELVSNAADALDKARFLSLTRKDVITSADEPRIDIKLDSASGTLVIDDNGIGMTRDEVVRNLGTIARSGSSEFLKAHGEAKAKEAGVNIIGQFGVGFYAAFMVASRVDVRTRSMLPDSQPVVWRSSGAGTFTVLPGEREKPGTEIMVALKDDAREYAEKWRIREIVRKYSDFVPFPIYVDGELVNRSTAIWSMPRTQVTDEQHTEFFRRITGSDAQTPLLRVHMSVEAPVQFHALLYAPEKAPPDLFAKDRRGLRLYAKRILIDEDCDQVVPPYLRFLRGVVDSEDLPLNVSREMLQEDKNLQQIQNQLVKSVLRALSDLAKNEPDRYERLWNEFGRVLKEGLVTDFLHKSELADLCRFASLRTEAGQWISLRQYADAMPASQKEIYFVTGPNRAALERGPHLEALKKRGIDVLLLTDPIDEWVVDVLTEYDKRRLKSVAHADLDFGEEAADEAAPADAVNGAIRAVKAALGARVKDVRISRRLSESASCLVAEEGAPSANRERLIRMLEGRSTESPRVLELNPKHPIVENLGTLAAREPGSERVRQWSELLLDQALLAEGVVEEPAALVDRMQRALTDLTTLATQSAQPATPQGEGPPAGQ